MHIEQKLQQLIIELKLEKEKAQKGFVSEEINSKEESYHFGKSHAFSFSINNLTEILNEVSVAAPTDEKLLSHIDSYGRP